ncbi:MAG TPA: hypothetical protein VGI40_15270 [Pirellulaceae bacterium]|jgi:hypothetical protein
MKAVVLDHCVPRPFGKLLTDCAITTAFERGWAELTNSDLLCAAEATAIDVLITADQNLRYQQNLATRRIAIIELPTNRLRLVSQYAARVNEILATIEPGAYEIVVL